MVKSTARTTSMGSLLLFSMASAKYQLMFYIVSGSFAIEAKSTIASELVFHIWMDNCFSVIFQERAVINIGRFKNRPLCFGELTSPIRKGYIIVTTRVVQVFWRIAYQQGTTLSFPVFPRFSIPDLSNRPNMVM